MSKSRNMADLLDSNGDVKSGALDNVSTPTLSSLGISNHDSVSVDSSGKVGVGVSTPAETVDIVGNFKASSTSPAIMLNNTDTNGKNYYITAKADGQLAVYRPDTYTDYLLLDSSGNLSATGDVTSSGGATKIGGTSILRSSAPFTLSGTATSIYENSTGTIGTGTYIVEFYVDTAGWYSEKWSGVLQWYGSGTNDNDATDIYLTGAGHAPVGKRLYARFKRFSGNNNNHAIQIWSNTGSTPNIQVRATRLL